MSETEEIKIGDKNLLEEGEIEEFKPEKMYELNQKNLQKDKKAQKYIKQTTNHLQNFDEKQQQSKSAQDLKQELIVQIFKEEEENDGAFDISTFSNKKILAYFQAK